jgi:hypothetical protein
MKKIFFSVIVLLFVLSACKKNNLNENNVWGYKDPNTALVRFIHSYSALTPSLAPLKNGPTVNFYINNKKMNGTAMSYSAVFPNVSGGGAYSEAPSGEVNIKVILNRTTGDTIPSDTLVNQSYLLAKGTAHSIILVDTIPNPTPSSPILMVIPESPSMPSYGKFKVRLLNLIPSNDLLDLYSPLSGTVVSKAPISYKNLSDWIELPITTIGSKYEIRLAGTDLIIASSATFIPGNQRSYTFFARGNGLVPSRPKTLSFFTTQ